jgi:hypothetical protein
MQALQVALLPLALCIVSNLSYAHDPDATSPSPPELQLAKPNGPSPQSTEVAESYAHIPLAFEENHGQAPADTRYLARGSGYQVHIASNALAVAVTTLHGKAPKTPAAIARMRLVGASAKAEAEGEGLLPSKSNYFIGPDPRTALTDVSNYSRVRFKDVYPGIDVVYYGAGGNLEYDLAARAGADLSRVRLSVSGTDRLSVDENGDVRVPLGSAEAILHRPTVYQDQDGARQSVAARYVLLPHNQVAIRLGAYDRSRSITIDPVLSYSTFLGGSNTDYANGIAVDSAGSAYVVGSAGSTNFPLLSNYQGLKKGSSTVNLAFITKFNTTGTGLVYSTFLGDSGTSAINQGFAIAVDGSGNAYVTGKTQGTAFPTTAGAYQTTSPGGANNSFVAKLGPAGNTLVYGTYLTGVLTASIAIDGSGNAYVTGQAGSAFTTTSGAFQTAFHAPNNSAFVVKLNATATTALYATYIGGSGNSAGYGIAVDTSGNAYVGGSTGATDFPVLNAFQSAAPGPGAGFVTKLNAAGSGLAYSTYLGGSSGDAVYAIAVDASGSAYVTGKTTSTNFPVTASAFQKTKGGASYNGLPNGFVTKLSSSGNTLIYSSFLGGNGSASNQSSYGDWGYAIAVDNGGAAYISGQVGSVSGFPLVGDLNPGLPEVAQGFFMAKVSAIGDALLYSTHIGWGIVGTPFGIAVDSGNNAYGVTTANHNANYSSSFLISSGAYQSAAPSGDLYDGIVTKLNTGPSFTATLSASSTSLISGQSVTVTATVAGGSGTPTGTVVIYDGQSQLAQLPLSNGTSSSSFTLPVGIHNLAAVYRNNGSEGVSPHTYVAVNPPTSCN